MPKRVEVQKCLVHLEEMRDRGWSHPGDLQYMQTLALFAISERLDTLNGIIAEIEDEKTKRAQQKETP